ncbi:MAG TPA: hypothetical protein VK348_15070 [Planctomycetota bacterium]|nr:hypothetical protein [Planctomycetota bacterium]
MRAAVALAFVVAGSAVLVPLPAQANGSPAPSRGIAARSSEVDAKVTDLLRAITWHSSLDDAKAAARSSGKPIFWLHMLGDLAGST